MYQPNAAQRERLALLLEEMGEAAHIAGKILRHGLDSTHADYANVPNDELLAKELGHVQAAMLLIGLAGDVSSAHTRVSRIAKLQKIKAGECFLHHQDKIAKLLP